MSPDSLSVGILFGFVVGMPLATILWVMHLVDRRELRDFQWRVNDGLIEIRCPACGDYFEAWNGQGIPQALDNGGRPIAVRCYGCGRKYRAIEQGGAVSIVSEPP